MFNPGIYLPSPGSISQRLRHVESVPETIWYVSQLTGNDDNVGTEPTKPFATISAAIAASTAGDMIVYGAGTYVEPDIDFNKSLTIQGTLQATIINSNPLNPAVTISGNNCIINEMVTVQPAGTGIRVTGENALFQLVVTASCVTGMSIEGAGTKFIVAASVAHSSIGFNVTAANCILYIVFSSGVGQNVTGFCLDGAGAVYNLLHTCTSLGNANSGFRASNGASFNVIKESTSGGGDGFRTDDGTKNSWDIKERTDTENYETIYPVSDGEGNDGVIDIDNVVTDDSGAGPWSDENYWGDVVEIIPPNTITVLWKSLGLNIFATTAADIQQIQIMFSNPNFCALRNGGNIWDYQETVLTVVDGTVIANGDKVWIRSDAYPNGEIVDVTDVTGNVVTIASETRISADTGLKYNHATNETMYVVYRSTDFATYPIDIEYSASTGKESARILWELKREVPANTGMLVRLVNLTDDGVSSLQASTIYRA